MNIFGYPVIDAEPESFPKGEIELGDLSVFVKLTIREKSDKMRLTELLAIEQERQRKHYKNNNLELWLNGCNIEYRLYWPGLVLMNPYSEWEVDQEFATEQELRNWLTNDNLGKYAQG